MSQRNISHLPKYSAQMVIYPPKCQIISIMPGKRLQSQEEFHVVWEKGITNRAERFEPMGIWFFKKRREKQ